MTLLNTSPYMHRVKLLSTCRCPYGRGFYITTILQETWIRGGQKTAESSLPYLHYICIPMDWPDLLDRTLQTVVKSVHDYASAKTQATKSIPKTSQRGNHILANESPLGIYNIQTTVGGLIQTTYLDYYVLFNTHACTNTYRHALNTPIPTT